MDHSFWLKRWQNADTGFHRTKAHPFLTTYWSDLELGQDSHVFVPLCGKSSDMLWLAERGHSIVGAELSSVAIKDFFDGINLAPDTEQDRRGLVLKTAAPYHLWQGDVFQLTRQDIGAIDAVYDRAALVALPPDMQTAYADLLAQLMPAGSQLFLISLDYDPKEMKGPPFSISEGQINDLFKEHFTIISRNTNADALDASPNLKERGLTNLTESLYVLTRRN